MAEGVRGETVVNVSPEDFYKVITDYNRYHEFVTGVVTSEERGRKGHEAKLYLEIDLFKRVRYTLAMKEEPNKRVSWTLHDGEGFKVNSGRWELSPLENGKKTNAVYYSEVAFNLFVPKMILNKLTELSLPRNLKDFKERAEDLYGN